MLQSSLKEVLEILEPSVPPLGLCLIARVLLPCLPQSSLKEVLENMEQTRTVWHMQVRCLPASSS